MHTSISCGHTANDAKTESAFQVQHVCSWTLHSKRVPPTEEKYPFFKACSVLLRPAQSWLAYTMHGMPDVPCTAWPLARPHADPAAYAAVFRRISSLRAPKHISPNAFSDACCIPAASAHASNVSASMECVLHAHTHNTISSKSVVQSMSSHLSSTTHSLVHNVIHVRFANIAQQCLQPRKNNWYKVCPLQVSY